MSQADISNSIGEKLRWWLAIAAVIGGIVGNLYFEDELATVLRVLILFGGITLGALIAATTYKGRSFFAFVKSANIERQKIVWPTRNETLQTTLIVIVVVVIIGLFLSLIDFFFSWLVGYFFG
ncbi:MAG: preprotein translocase subunit SecE [Alcanivoracaceae bacterium]|nr:preprotein translocase subunit SecE [Alcanivoracaceae bacterium]